MARRPPRRRKQSRSRRWPKVVLLLLVLAGLAVATLPWSLRYGLQWSLARVSGEPSRVGRVGVDLITGEILVEDVEIGPAPDPALRLRSLALEIGWAALAGARFAFERVNAETGSVSILAAPRGGWRVGGIPLDTLRSWPLPVLGNINLSHLGIVFRPGPDQRELRVKHGYLARLDPFDTRPARFSLDARFGDGIVQAEGVADLLARRVRVTGDARVIGLPLAGVSSLWFGPETPAVEGQLGYKGWTEARFDPGADAWQLDLDGEAELRQVRLARSATEFEATGTWRGKGLLRLDQRGIRVFEARGVAEGGAARLAYPGTGLGLAVEGLQWDGQVRYDDRLSRWRLSGDAQLDGPRLTAAGDVRVSASRAELWGVEGSMGDAWTVGRLRLEQPEARAGGDAAADGLTATLVEVSQARGAPGQLPRLGHLVLEGAFATLVPGGSGWTVAGLPPFSDWGTAIDLVELGAGSRLLVENGDLWQLDLHAVHGQITALDPGDPGNPSRLQGRAALPGGGEVTANGVLHPLAPGHGFRLQAHAEGFPLAVVSGLLEEPLGYRGAGGSLAGRLSVVSDGGVVEVDAAVRLVRAVFERAPARPDRFAVAAGRSLPAALALLRDGRGEVELRLQASVADWGRDLAGHVTASMSTAFADMFQPFRDADSPVEAGLGGLHLFPVEFPAGGARLGPGAVAYLRELARALQGYPGVTVGVCPGGAGTGAPNLAGARSVRAYLVETGALGRARVEGCPAGAEAGSGDTARVDVRVF